MPSRLASLEKSIGQIARQVDHLHVYLDKYSEVPSLLEGYGNVTPYLPEDVAGILGKSVDWRGAGKFVGAILSGDCLYCTFDDDIIYPDGYSTRLADALARYDYRALVGIHGSTYRRPYESYAWHRQDYHFEAPLVSDVFVDAIGSGTLAFRNTAFTPDFFKWANIKAGLDLMVAIDASRMGLSKVAVARPPAYLRAIDEDQDDSVWREVKRDDSALSGIMNANKYLWEQRITSQPSRTRQFLRSVYRTYLEPFRRGA